MLTGISSRPPKVGLWEPGEGRPSRRVLREPGGEIPPGHSPGRVAPSRVTPSNPLYRFLNPTTGQLAHRVAGVLVVLFGQPFTRVVTLGIDDIVVGGGTVGIRLGRDVTPVPAPFAGMFGQLALDRPNRTTATNPTSPWLFPGRMANTHLTAGLLRGEVRAMGISNLGARSGALRQLVLDCPPTVIADMLGYTYKAIEHHAQQAGSRWASYAALRDDQLANPRGVTSTGTTGPVAIVTG